MQARYSSESTIWLSLFGNRADILSQDMLSEASPEPMATIYSSTDLIYMARLYSQKSWNIDDFLQGFSLGSHSKDDQD